MKNILVFLTTAFLMACGGVKPDRSTQENSANAGLTSHHIPQITKIFDAHGGFANWSKLKMLSYKMGGSTTLTDLQNRYTRIESENQTVGFDGKQVWVYPASEDADKQRMRYNLMFYFYAFPFIVGDPGVNYEALEPIDLQGTSYDAVKITFDNGVGDASNDSYIICSDPTSGRMHWLMYTATFGGEPKDNYSLIKYEGWTELGGVVLPTSLQWVHYKDGVVGDPKGEAVRFENIEVAQEYPSIDQFEMPEGAAIAK
jgi:hypothetical protein